MHFLCVCHLQPADFILPSFFILPISTLPKISQAHTQNLSLPLYPLLILLVHHKQWIQSCFIFIFLPLIVYILNWDLLNDPITFFCILSSHSSLSSLSYVYKLFLYMHFSIPSFRPVTFISISLTNTRHLFFIHSFINSFIIFIIHSSFMLMPWLS